MCYLIWFQADYTPREAITKCCIALVLIFNVCFCFKVARSSASARGGHAGVARPSPVPGAGVKYVAAEDTVILHQRLSSAKDAA